MSENEEKKSPGVFSRNWVKVTAGVLGGTLILGGTFAAGAGFGSKVDPRGFGNAMVASNFNSDRPVQKNGERGFRAQGFEQRSHGGHQHGLADLSEQERLDRLNQWLDSVGVEPLEKLPEQLSGTGQKLREQMQLEMLNQRLEKLGIDALDELPEQLPNS